MNAGNGAGRRWRLPEAWHPAHDVFAFHEDTNANAVVITRSGEIYAVAEERLTRSRFQGGFPRRALAWIEQASGARIQDAPLLVFGNRTHFLPRLLGPFFPSYEHDLFGLPQKLMLSFHHLCYRSRAFAGFWAAFNGLLLGLRFRKRIRLVDHHRAHAASAYYTSGMTEACAVSADNYGDGYAAKVFDCAGPCIRFVRGVSALCSPGQFYGEIAQVAGIHPLLAGKLTGMAASGDPTVAASEMRRLFDIEDRGRGFTRTFGWRRSAASDPFPRLKDLPRPDLAAAAQRRFEEVLVRYVRQAAIDTGRRNVVLAGGSFANVRVNQQILELPEVDAVWIHPAMTDQGIAMGAALAHIGAGRAAFPFKLENVLLGPEPTEAEIRAALESDGLPYTRPDDLEERAARLLADGKVIARFAGPLEYGLRALGNRSILYQPQDAGVQAWLNERLQRAAYMPFAPITMEPYAERCYVDVASALETSRFMTISFHATDWMKANCPGVVHVDGTVRPQVLRESDNPAMYRILECYRQITGLPSLLNTSFNLHEEPIVASARDACLAFRRASLDYMIAGPYLVERPG